MNDWQLKMFCLDLAVRNGAGKDAIAVAESYMAWLKAVPVQSSVLDKLRSPDESKPQDLSPEIDKAFDAMIQGRRYKVKG